MTLLPLDAVIHGDRRAIVLVVWPDRTLARIRFSDTGQRRTVLVSELQK